MALVESFSGVRGIYDKDLTESIAVRYAHAYFTFLKKKTKKNSITLVVGMDTRPSGLKLSETILGLIDCSFIDVGILPTPAIEFAVRHFDADGGIIITASHNEPFWNGFKFLGPDGAILNEKEMNRVISYSKRLKDFHKIEFRKVSEKNTEAVKKYEDFILDIVGGENIENIKESKQKIVLDPNGGTGAIAKKILERIGVEVVGINMKYGEFNRTIEPTEDSMIYLTSAIDENKADFAAGFDCDADRVEILMKNGGLLSGQNILALVVNEFLSTSDNPKNEVVVVNSATSNVVRDVVVKHGAKIKEVEVGETNVIEEMKKVNSTIGGEGSSGGAIIFPSKCRDGILTLLMILSIIAKKQKKLEEIIKEFPKYYTLRKKLEFDSKKHDKIKKSLKEHYSKKGFEIKETGGINGGLKIITGKNSFVWFRASKTESDVFRIISDSDSKEEAKKLIEEGVRTFNEQ
ncbi:hypothetical protein CMO83_04840 [Candidatus Woesearchaeota archaeon]|jgi:phosphomannomutase|nr:hypothetical protein [Candidatus Woesearchaeota archaeon]MDP6648207.1 hypothetical protein [Candidatus Woesearchaeota archaeon]|tara:strand:+ start:36412 stop:37797 length:1386 start_codon:yes stop_codon:yes gene_type:complete